MKMLKKRKITRKRMRPRMINSVRTMTEWCLLSIVSLDSRSLDNLTQIGNRPQGFTLSQQKKR